MAGPVLSCYANCFGPAGVRAAVIGARDAGLDRIELALRGHDFGGLVIPESAVVTEEADDATAASLVELLRLHGVRASACNVGGPDVGTEQGVAKIERKIRFARRWFDAPVVVSNAGKPADAAGRAAVVRNLRRLGDVGDELDVTIALETHAGPTQDADAMLALMADVGHPRVRLNFDTGNIAYYNRGADPVAELRRVAPWVANVHLKDNRGGFEDWYFPEAGKGTVDFRAIRSVLGEAGYAGACAIEIEGIGGEPEPGGEERARRVARSVLHLRRCGFATSDGRSLARRRLGVAIDCATIPAVVLPIWIDLPAPVHFLTKWYGLLGTVVAVVVGIPTSAVVGGLGGVAVIPLQDAARALLDRAGPGGDRGSAVH